MTDLDRLVGDAVARETAATATPDYGVLAVRARHHRLRRVALGAVAVAAGVAVVALVVPFGSGGAPAPAVAKPFERIARDETAQANVRSCMMRGGYGLGDGPLPGLPGGPSAMPEQSFVSLYDGCLAAAGYRPPTPALQVVGPCDDLLGTKGPGATYRTGLAGGRLWRVGAYLRENGVYCAWHSYGDSTVAGVTASVVGPDEPRFTRLGASDVLVYGFAPWDVSTVAIHVRGEERQRLVPKPFYRPGKRVYAFAVRFDGDLNDLTVVLYGSSGQVVRQSGG